MPTGTISSPLKSLHYRRPPARAHQAGRCGHTGGDLSCIDILNVLYNRILRWRPATFTDPRRDRYVQSKGPLRRGVVRCAPATRIFPAAELATLGRYQSHYVGHPTRQCQASSRTPGRSATVCRSASGWRSRRRWTVRTTAYSPCSATANWPRDRTGKPRCRRPPPARQPHRHRRLQHAPDLRPHPRCDELPEPLEEKWTAFGWAVRRVDGHDLCGIDRGVAARPRRRPAVRRDRPHDQGQGRPASWRTSENGITACRTTTNTPAPSRKSTTPSPGWKEVPRERSGFVHVFSPPRGPRPNASA